MAQMMPLSREAVGIAETLQDVWFEVTADGLVEAHELTQVTTLIVDVAQMTNLADTAQAYAIAAMRRGPESRNAQDRSADVVIMETIILDREQTSMARKAIEEQRVADDMRARVAAEATALGMTVDQYTDLLTGVVTELVIAKREEGRRILASRAEASAA